MTDPRAPEMHRLYDEGATLEAVGTRFGIGRERVRQIFRDAGLPTRSVKEAMAMRHARFRERRAALAHRVAETGDLDYVAVEFAVTPAELTRIIREAAPELLKDVTRAGDRVPLGYWTRERILEAIRRWAELYGKPPSATDWNPAMARRLGHVDRVARFEEGLWPYVSSVRRRFDSWNDAIRAAGFEATRVSSYGRPGDDPEVVQQAVDYYQGGAALSEAAERAGISQAALSKAVTKAGIPLPGERLAERIRAFLRGRDWTPVKTITFALPDAPMHVYSALHELRRDPELEFLEMAGRGVFVRERR